MCLHTIKGALQDSFIVLRRERDSLAKIYLSVSFELSEIRAPVRGCEKALSFSPKNKRSPSGLLYFFAEREGFEPPEPLSSTVFKTAAIDHSAISPSKSAAKVLLFFQIYKFLAKILANMRKI